jgi:hypothetical protein
MGSHTLSLSRSMSKPFLNSQALRFFACQHPSSPVAYPHVPGPLPSLSLQARLRAFLESLIALPELRNQPLVLSFLELSPFSFVADAGPKCKEGKVDKVSCCKQGREIKESERSQRLVALANVMVER